MKSDAEFYGKIVHVGECESVGAKGFKKRLIVLSDGDLKYEQRVPFELTGRDAEADPPKVGEMATVEYRLKGREWQGRYYASLWALKVTPDSALEAGDWAAWATPAAAVQAPAESKPAEKEEELPF
jgi:hypothetical protein